MAENFLFGSTLVGYDGSYSYQLDFLHDANSVAKLPERFVSTHQYLKNWSMLLVYATGLAL